MTYSLNGNGNGYGVHVAPDPRPEPRYPPHNREAEEAVLGAMLIDPEAHIDVGDFLQAKHFYSVGCGWIYEAMMTIGRRGEPVDTLTLLEELRRQDRLEAVGGEPYIISLVSAVPTSLNAEIYGRIVEETAMRRDMIAAAGEIATLAYDESAPLDVQLDKAEQQILRVRAHRVEQNVYEPQVHAMGYLARLEELMTRQTELSGLDTGLPDLNRVLDGLQAGQLYVLAGRPGMGKSALGVQIAWHVAQQSHVFCWSGEMGEFQLDNRIVAYETGIDSRRLKNPKELRQMNESDWKKIYQCVNKIANSGLIIDTSGGITAEQLRSKCLRANARNQLELIVVDHLHLMETADARRDEMQAIAHNVGELRKLAKLMNIPVLCLAQLSRSCENRQDKRPLMSDLRQAGKIEEDAYGVILAYRDEYYNPDTTLDRHIAELNVAKNRDGETSLVKVYFQETAPAFRSLQREEIQL